jgi:hypothetical protein
VFNFVEPVKSSSQPIPSFLNTAAFFLCLTDKLQIANPINALIARAEDVDDYE